MSDVLGEYMASQQRMLDRSRDQVRERVRTAFEATRPTEGVEWKRDRIAALREAFSVKLPPDVESILGTIPNAISDAVRTIQEAEEQLVRDHFADTPLALASVLRTGVMPWNIELQVMRENPDFDDPMTLRIRKKARVVEYPR